MTKYSKLALACCFFASSVSAGTMGYATADWNYVATIAVGPAWAKGGDTQTFFLAPNIEKTYVANKQNNILPLGEFFLGMAMNVTPGMQGHFGIEVTAAGNSKMEGIIWDDADPMFDNYSYEYKVRHTAVTAKARFICNNDEYYALPWVSAAVGAGFNRASSFINTPLIFEAVPNNNFTTKSTTAFSYTIGVGLQKQMDENWQLGIGYEFSDWGKSELGRAAEQTMNSGLKADNIYTSGLMFNITFLA